MYHHANANINPPQSCRHDSNSTKSSETRRKQIPLAFTNTEWGRQYTANPNWSNENLGTRNPSLRQRSRCDSNPGNKADSSASVSGLLHDTSAPKPKSCSMDPETTASRTLPRTLTQPLQQYSAMASWNCFRRTFARSASPSSPVQPENEKPVAMGPWLESLMQWDDFEQWQLKLLEQPWWLCGTA
ncbi:hypothetical protein E4T48_05168 [Aureobasidium sp. EXF-10727]|nr:hypothetical protein E4T48_05168 [Aureobasidium sp. EXF-10727]